MSTCCANHPDRPARARGLCGACYAAASRAGSLPPRKLLSAPDLLVQSRLGRSDHECWPWAGNINDAGYGRVRVANVLYRAHRWAYAEMVGPIPDDMELDHLCHTADLQCLAGKGCPHRPCVNYLNHLQPVTPLQNWERGRSITRLEQERDRCPEGHLYDMVSNTTRDGLVRRCSTCTYTSNRASAGRHTRA